MMTQEQRSAHSAALARKIAGRKYKGWAFSGESREWYAERVEEIERDYDELSYSEFRRKYEIWLYR